MRVCMLTSPTFPCWSVNESWCPVHASVGGLLLVSAGKLSAANNRAVIARFQLAFVTTSMEFIQQQQRRRWRAVSAPRFRKALQKPIIILQ